MAIAAPDLIEWVPTSEALKPSLSSPIAFTPSLSASVMSDEVMNSILSFFHTALTVVSGVAPG